MVAHCAPLDSNAAPRPPPSGSAKEARPLRGEKSGSLAAPVCEASSPLSPTALNFSSHSVIRAAGLAPLERALRGCDHLQSLDLSANGLGPEAARRLAEVLGHCPGLTCLHLGRNLLGMAGAGPVAKALLHCPVLAGLDLANNALGPEGAAQLVPSLRTRPLLATVDLSRNGLGPKGAVQVAQALRHCVNLTCLRLAGNGIRAKGSARLSQALRHCPSLAELGLEHNALCAEGMQLWAQVLPLFPRLAIVRLADNSLGAEGAALLAQALPRCRSLASLDISFNRLGAKGAANLAQALPHCPGLTELAAAGNSLGEAGAAHLAHALCYCAALTSLDLGRNSLGEGVAHLALALARCAHLAVLRLPHNAIACDGAAELARALPYWLGLRELDLSHNAIAQPGAAALAQALPACPGLAELYLTRNPVPASGLALLAGALAAHPARAATDLPLHLCLPELRLPRALEAASGEAILDLLRQRAAQGTHRMAVVPVVLVGPASAGKSSLAQALAAARRQQRLAGPAAPHSVELVFHHASGLALLPRPSPPPVFLVVWDPAEEEAAAATATAAVAAAAAASGTDGGGERWEAADGVHPHARGILDAHTGAQLLFVASKADQADTPGSGAVPCGAATTGPRTSADQLRLRYGAAFRGLHVVSAFTGSGLAELLAAVEAAAEEACGRWPEEQGDQVPASYLELHRRIAARCDREVCVPFEVWEEETVAAGVPRGGGVDTALDLFHAWGLVFRLVSQDGGSSSSGGSGGSGRPCVVLRPQGLAGLLDQVLTRRPTGLRHCRRGLLRHSELDTIWPAREPRLHQPLLEVLHEQGLGVHLADFNATLVPGMLGYTGAEAEAGAQLEQLLEQQAPPLPRQADCRVVLSCSAARLLPRLLVQLRHLIILGGWWRGGCLVADRDPRSGQVRALGAVDLKSSSNPVTAAAAATTTTSTPAGAMDLGSTILRIRCYGSCALRQRVLDALGQLVRVELPGVQLVDTSLTCAHDEAIKDRTFAWDDLCGARDGVVECWRCGRRHQTRPVVEWFLGLAAAAARHRCGVHAHDARHPDAVEVAEHLAELAPEACGNAAGDMDALGHLQEQLDESQAGEADPAEQDRLALQCLAFLTGPRAPPAMESATVRGVLWLVFHDPQHPGSRGAAYPLVPRPGGMLGLPAALGVDLGPQHGTMPVRETHPEQLRVDHLVRSVLEDACVPPPEPSLVFESVLWDSLLDRVTRRAVRDRVQQHFLSLQHPEVGPLRVACEDRTALRDPVALLATETARARVQVDAQQPQSASLLPLPPPPPGRAWRAELFVLFPPTALPRARALRDVLAQDMVFLHVVEGKAGHREQQQHQEQDQDMAWATMESCQGLVVFGCEDDGGGDKDDDATPSRSPMGLEALQWQSPSHGQRPIIPIRMIPWHREFRHHSARSLFGRLAESVLHWEQVPQEKQVVVPPTVVRGVLGVLGLRPQPR